MKKTVPAFALAALVLVSAVAVLPTTGAQTFAGGGQQSVAAPHEHSSPNNWTTDWRDGGTGDTGDPSSDPWGMENPQYPGNQDITFRAFSAGFPGDLTPIGNLTVLYPSAQTNACEITQARAFGIDRDNDNAGTQTDASMLNFKGEFAGTRNGSAGGINDGKNYTTYSFYNEGEGFQDQTIDLFQPDQIVASLADCFNQPQTPGWYRWLGGLNGTQDGDPDDQSGGEWRSENWFGDDPDEQAFVYSHWYYVCQCDSRQDAIDKMGPPPTSGQTAPVLWAENGVLNTEVALVAYDTNGDGQNELVYNDRTTDPADYWASDTGNGYQEGNWEERQSRAASNGGGSNATATPTQPSPGGTETTGPGTGTATGPDNGTATGPDNGTATGPDNGTMTGPGTGTETGTGGNGAMTTETTTGGNGPGFGFAVAVAALLGAALLALRRD